MIVEGGYRADLGARMLLEEVFAALGLPLAPEKLERPPT